MPVVFSVSAPFWADTEGVQGETKYHLSTLGLACGEGLLFFSPTFLHFFFFFCFSFLNSLFCGI